MGYGASWMLGKLRRKTLAAAGAIVLMLPILMSFASAYQDRLSAGANAWGLGEVRAARFLQRVVPRNARIIVASPSPSMEHDRPLVCQDPVIFFFSDRYGWSLPRDGIRPDRIAELREAGADYLVLCEECNGVETPALAAYLAGEATRIGPDFESRWGIYRLERDSAGDRGTDADADTGAAPPSVPSRGAPAAPADERTVG